MGTNELAAAIAELLTDRRAKRYVRDLCAGYYYMRMEREFQIFLSRRLNESYSRLGPTVCEHNYTDILAFSQHKIEMKYTYAFYRGRDIILNPIKEDVLTKNADVFVLIILNTNLDSDKDKSHFRPSQKERRKKWLAKVGFGNAGRLWVEWLEKVFPAHKVLLASMYLPNIKTIFGLSADFKYDIIVIHK